MKRSFLNSIGILLLWTLGGCYEGYKKENTDNDVPPEDPPSPRIPPYEYVLLQGIYLASEAYVSPCFENSAVVSYRQREIELRLASLASALESLTSTLEIQPIEVASDDCMNLSVLLATAASTTPWGAGQGPNSDAERPVLHVKAILWVEAEQAPFLPNLGPDWQAWQDLTAAGLDARSRHYFVMDQQKTGFFQEWQASLPAESSFSATYIRNIDPTDEGIAERNGMITTDTTNFIGMLN